jgi:hypothetical protein
MLKVYDRFSTTGSFRALRFVAGKVSASSNIMTRKAAHEEAEKMAKANPGDLIEVVEVEHAYKGVTQVAEVVPFPLELAGPAA